MTSSFYFRLKQEEAANRYLAATDSECRNLSAAQGWWIEELQRLCAASN